MAKKSLQITKFDYILIKQIIKDSSCMANAYQTVEKVYNVTRDQAYTLVNAVYNDYKYLKVV